MPAYFHFTKYTSCSLLFPVSSLLWGFPDGSVVKNLPAKQEMWVPSLGREGPLEKEMTTYSIILPGKSYGQRRLLGYSPWGHKRVRHNLATKQQHANKMSMTFIFIPFGTL